MNKTPSIKILFAALALLALTLGITPKQHLHAVFAGHEDVSQTLPIDGKQHLAQAGFDCECNSLVATSPFLESGIAIEAISSAIYAEFISADLSFQKGLAPITTSLRGPPSAN